MFFALLLSLSASPGPSETTVIYSSYESGERGRSDGNGPVSV